MGRKIYAFMFWSVIAFVVYISVADERVPEPEPVWVAMLQEAVAAADAEEAEASRAK